MISLNTMTGDKVSGEVASSSRRLRRNSHKRYSVVNIIKRDHLLPSETGRFPNPKSQCHQSPEWFLLFTCARESQKSWPTFTHNNCEDWSDPTFGGDAERATIVRSSSSSITPLFSYSSLSNRVSRGNIDYRNSYGAYIRKNGRNNVSAKIKLGKVIKERKYCGICWSGCCVFRVVHIDPEFGESESGSESCENHRHHHQWCDFIGDCLEHTDDDGDNDAFGMTEWQVPRT